MFLHPFNAFNPDHLSALVRIWNAACGADLAINLRVVRYCTQPAPGAVQAGRFAQHDGTMIGCVLASALPNDPLTSPPEVGWIDAIAVLPEFRRRGVGSELLSWAEAWLTAQGCAAARLGGSLRPFAPGYPVELEKLGFFKSRGYLERVSTPAVWDLALDLAKAPKPLRGYPAGGLARAAQPDDKDALLKFFQQEFPNRWFFEFQEFLQMNGRMRDYELLIADSDVVGFARLTFEDSERPIERFYPHRLPRPWGQLGPIGIGSAHRGRGFGTMLLDVALGELKSRGVRGCVIDWTDLLDFYSKFGFRPYRRYTVLSKSIATRTAPATGS